MKINTSNLLNITLATSEKMDQVNFEKFIVDEEITSASNRWNNYIERFKNMLIAFKITGDGRKKALLLHYGGEQLFEIYKSFTNEDTENADFNKMVDLLTEYFAPQKNTDYQIHLFRKIKQREGESIDSFHSKLRRVVLTCDFHDINKEIKTQVIQNCSSQRLRRKALREHMTLQRILATGRSDEIAEEQAKLMEGKEATYQIKKFTGKGKQAKTDKECFRCGGKYPHTKNCPAMGKKCAKCGKENHFAKVCRSKNQINEVQDSGTTTESDVSDGECAFGL